MENIKMKDLFHIDINLTNSRGRYCINYEFINGIKSFITTNDSEIFDNFHSNDEKQRKQAMNSMLTLINSKINML